MLFWGVDTTEVGASNRSQGPALNKSNQQRCGKGAHGLFGLFRAAVTRDVGAWRLRSWESCWLEAGKSCSSFYTVSQTFAGFCCLFFTWPEQRSVDQFPHLNESHRQHLLVSGRHLLVTGDGSLHVLGLWSSRSQHTLCTSHWAFNKIILRETWCKWEPYVAHDLVKSRAISWQCSTTWSSRRSSPVKMGSETRWR